MPDHYQRTNLWTGIHEALRSFGYYLKLDSKLRKLESRLDDRHFLIDTPLRPSRHNLGHPQSIDRTKIMSWKSCAAIRYKNFLNPWSWAWNLGIKDKCEAGYKDFLKLTPAVFLLSVTSSTSGSSFLYLVNASPEVDKEMDSLSLFLFLSYAVNGCSIQMNHHSRDRHYGGSGAAQRKDKESPLIVWN